MGETNLESSSETSKYEGANSSLRSANLQWRDFVKDLKEQWKMLWRNRIDDKVRAEGVAREDNPMLFVDKGTVIVATRKYKPPDFVEILNLHRQERRRVEKVGTTIQMWPSSSGWRKFITTVIKSQPRFSLRRRPQPSKGKREGNLQKKKGGRGWTHRF